MRPLLVRLGVVLVLALPAHAQDLVGHGGPVGALDAGAGVLVSGGFDTRAILWDLTDGTARNVTRFHDGNVTAVRLLPDGGFVTAGQDGRLAVWSEDGRDPVFSTPAGASAVSSLAVSADGRLAAFGSWDGRIALLDLETRVVAQVQAHSQRVTGLGFLPGGGLVSAGGDLFLTRWSADLKMISRQGLPGLPNGLAQSGDGVSVIFADGVVRRYSDAGALEAESFLSDRPLVAITASATQTAAAAIDGRVWLLAPDDLAQRATFLAEAGPVWALALTRDHLFTSGGAGVIRRWSGADGSPLGATAAAVPSNLDDGSRGAEVWKSCAVCHSLTAGDQTKAGPSLHAIFGQRIGTQPGYDYSTALRGLDIVWTPRTVAELFELGPEAYTPGSRMPEQRIAAPEDRAALVDFLQRVATSQD
jgi:cytochrome c